jgi:hypothetical protein
MLKPSILKEVLASGLGLYTKSVLIFSFNEGSIIAKVGQDDNIHSQAALLSTILHEYVEFGN